MLEIGFIVSMLLVFVIGVVVISKNKHNFSNQVFFLIILAMILWQGSNLAIQLSSQDTILFWVRLAHLTAITLLSSIAYFSFIFPQDLFKNAKTLGLIGIIPVVIGCILCFSPNLIISASIEGGKYSFESGSLFNFYSIGILLILVIIFTGLGRQLKVSQGFHKGQVRYLLFGIVIASLFGVSTDLLLPLAGIKQFADSGPLGLIFFVGFTAYAIITQQLFDIRIVIKRTLVYSGLLLFTLATYSMVIFFFTTLFGGESAFNPKTFIANLIAATLIAVGFDPIRKYLTKVTDKYLFKGEYDTQVVLAKLTQLLSNSVDMQEACQSLVSTVKIDMRLAQTAVITFNVEDNRVAVKNTIQDGYADSSVLQLTSENLFLQQIMRNPEMLIAETITRRCENKALSGEEIQTCQMLLVDLKKLGVAIAIPLVMAEKVIGVFLVGDKLSGDTFTTNDIDFLKIVANQTTNAIQKARFWEEDQLKSEFVSIASHELLTPTAAIKGYLSMILEDNMGEIDDKARAMLTKVLGSADRLAHLVEDLLNVSRIESGRLKINKRTFSLVESVQKAVEELKVNAQAKNIDLAFVADQNTLPQVYADPDHIYRVLINLIGNAIKYTPRGWVRCFVTQSSPTHLLFTVVDSGLGIPAEHQAHLFEKFYRADRREIYGIQGTGLGLYISKKVVELLGGQISLSSAEGKGTTFYVTVPVATGNEPQPEAVAAPAVATQAAPPPPPPTGTA